MNLKPVFYVSGILLLVLSVAMFIPMMVDLAGGSPDWRVFASSQIVTTFIGFLLIFTNREKDFRMTVRETFLMTVLGWIFLSAFGALPFCLSVVHLSPAKGFFEAMSGITTTGLTAITGLDGQPHGILLWRALLHWLGGMGALVSALSILPLLQVSGQQVFRAQSIDIAKVLPSANQMAAYICLIYIGLTLACALMLHGAGFSGFEALCHAMSALSTGGFSTSDASVGHFDNPVAEIVLMYFMLLGSIPFTLYLRMGRRDLFSIFRDGQVRAFLGATAGFSVLLTGYLLWTTDTTLSDALRHGVFRAVSLMTTSGLTLQDNTLWGPFAAALFFVMVFIGGCSGSTAGGVRIFRVQILLSMLKLQIRRLIEPNGVFQAYYGSKPVDTEIQNAIAAFLLVYILTFAVAGVLLMMCGLDFAPAFTGAFAALSNTGAALASTGTPMPPFSVLPSTPLWILSACMLLGRMEIFTVFVLFAPRFWRR